MTRDGEMMPQGKMTRELGLLDAAAACIPRRLKHPIEQALAMEHDRPTVQAGGSKKTSIPMDHGHHCAPP